MIKHNKKFMASRAVAKCFVSMMGQNITKLKFYDFPSKKFNTKLPYDVAVPLLGILIPRRIKSRVAKR